MSQSPYAPPSSRVADRPEAPHLPRPKQVVVAVRLLWFGLALSFPVWYLGASRSPEYGFHPGFVAFTMVLFAISALLNVLVYRGRNWARIVSLVFFVLAGILFLIPFEEPMPPGAVEQVLNAVIFLIELGALYLLFSRPGSLWFRRRE